MLVDELEPADVTALVADSLHQTDRVGAELFEMTVFFFAAGDARHDSGCHLLTPHRRAYLAPHRRFAKS